MGEGQFEREEKVRDRMEEERSPTGIISPIPAWGGRRGCREEKRQVRLLQSYLVVINCILLFLPPPPAMCEEHFPHYLAFYKPRRYLKQKDCFTVGLRTTPI